MVPRELSTLELLFSLLRAVCNSAVDWLFEELKVTQDAFQTYQAATGAVLDNNTGLLTLTADQYANLSNLVFIIGGVSMIAFLNT
jgi:hypothetical protein